MFDFRNEPAFRVFKVLGCGIVIVKTETGKAEPIPDHVQLRSRCGVNVERGEKDVRGVLHTLHLVDERPEHVAYLGCHYSVLAYWNCSMRS